MHAYNDTIRTALEERARALEEHFDADVAFYHGQIDDGLIRPFRDFIERLAGENLHSRKLAMFFNSPGGSAETVEKLVEILRFHYRTVDFVVPDYALSAATILCMSGDRIFTEYVARTDFEIFLHSRNYFQEAR